MNETPAIPRKLPGPWSWQHSASALLAAIGYFIGQKIAGLPGGIIGLLCGIAISIVVLLIWVSRPRKRG